MNELEKRAKKHKKTIKPGAMGWFVHPNPGDPVAMDRFNNSVDTSAAAQGGESVGVSESMLNEDIYTENGYSSRSEYLTSLADEYGVDPQRVFQLAEILGPEEDFDMLVSQLEDMMFESEFYGEDDYEPKYWAASYYRKDHGEFVEDEDYQDFMNLEDAEEWAWDKIQKGLYVEIHSSDVTDDFCKKYDADKFDEETQDISQVEVTESLHESYEAINDKIKQLEDAIRDTTIMAEIYPYNEYCIEATVEDGDWKHEHLLFKNIIAEVFGPNQDFDVEAEPSDSDTYTATYYIPFDDLRPASDDAYGRSEWDEGDPWFGDINNDYDESLEERTMTNREIREALNKLDLEALEEDKPFNDLRTLYEATQLSFEDREIISKALQKGEDAEMITTFLLSKVGGKDGDYTTDESLEEEEDEEPLQEGIESDLKAIIDSASNVDELQQAITKVEKAFTPYDPRRKKLSDLAKSKIEAIEAERKAKEDEKKSKEFMYLDKLPAYSDFDHKYVVTSSGDVKNLETGNFLTPSGNPSDIFASHYTLKRANGKNCSVAVNKLLDQIQSYWQPELIEEGLSELAREAENKLQGKYGWISNVSDLEVALHDAQRHDENEDIEIIQELIDKYDKTESLTEDEDDIDDYDSEEQKAIKDGRRTGAAAGIAVGQITPGMPLDDVALAGLGAAIGGVGGRHIYKHNQRKAEKEQGLTESSEHFDAYDQLVKEAGYTDDEIAKVLSIADAYEEEASKGVITYEQMDKVADMMGLADMSDSELRRAWDMYYDILSRESFAHDDEPGLESWKKYDDAASAFAEVINREARKRKEAGNYNPDMDESLDEVLLNGQTEDEVDEYHKSFFKNEELEKPIEDYLKDGYNLFVNDSDAFAAVYKEGEDDDSSAYIDVDYAEAQQLAPKLVNTNEFVSGSKYGIYKLPPEEK